jgi:hypothetical protein
MEFQKSTRHSVIPTKVGIQRRTDWIPTFVAQSVTAIAGVISQLVQVEAKTQRPNGLPVFASLASLRELMAAFRAA